MLHPFETTLLLQNARAGCRQSFGRLWSEHVGGVRAAVYRLLREPLAEDVVQDVALAALAGIASLRDTKGATFAAWLRAIARNRARTALQSKLRNREIAMGDDAVDACAARCGREDDAGRGGEVRRALAHLPRCYRVPLRLRYLRGCSGSEIAARLHMTHGSVRVSLCRGLQRMRAGLVRSGGVAHWLAATSTA